MGLSFFLGFHFTEHAKWTLSPCSISPKGPDKCNLWRQIWRETTMFLFCSYQQVKHKPNQSIRLKELNSFPNFSCYLLKSEWTESRSKQRARTCEHIHGGSMGASFLGKGWRAAEAQVTPIITYTLARIVGKIKHKVTISWREAYQKSFGWKYILDCWRSPYHFPQVHFHSWGVR